MLNNRLQYAKGSPAAVALDILRYLNIQNFPIEPRSIAEALGIVIWERELPETCDGCLMRVKDVWGILINSRICSESRRNFTIAHEIGHYMLERDTVDSCSLAERLNSMMKKQDKEDAQASWNSQEYIKSENRANQFAVELLMPSPIFLADSASHSQIGLPAIAELASQYATSFTSTGIHYTRLSEHVCAIVFSEGGTIRYFAYSNGFRKNKDCYLVSGQSLHPESLASRVRKELYVDELTDEVALSYWCEQGEKRRNAIEIDRKNKTIIEQSRRIPRTKQVISFLYLP